MFKGLTDTPKYLIIGGVLLVLSLGIGIYLYFSGKASGKRAGSINLSAPTGPDGTAPAASTSEISQIAGQIFTDMDGVNFFGHNSDTWKRFLALSDADVIRVYNEFDTQHQKATGQSLTQWVNSESSGGLLDGWSTIQPTVLQRLNKLKLI